MSVPKEAIAAKKTPALATSGGLSWSTRAVINNDNVAEQQGLARLLGQRAEFNGYINGHVGFLQAVNGSWFAAYSGDAMGAEHVAPINLVLRGTGNPPRPYTFINRVAVHQDFITIAGLVAQADSDAGRQPGCAEKKLMSYFESNSLEPAIATMATFRISFGGTADARATWVWPCGSCQHCLVHFWNNLRTVAV